MTGSSASGRQRSQAVIASFSAAISAIARRWYASWMSSGLAPPTAAPGARRPPRERRVERGVGGSGAMGDGRISRVRRYSCRGAFHESGTRRPRRRPCGARARRRRGGRARRASPSASRKSDGPVEGAQLGDRRARRPRAAPPPLPAQPRTPIRWAMRAVSSSPVPLGRPGHELAAVDLAAEARAAPAGEGGGRGPVRVGRHHHARPARARRRRPPGGRGPAPRRAPRKSPISAPSVVAISWPTTTARSSGAAAATAERGGDAVRARPRRRPPGRARGRRRRSARGRRRAPGAARRSASTRSSAGDGPRGPTRGPLR